MGTSITPMYAETLILLKLWAFEYKGVKKDQLGLSATYNKYLTSLEQAGAIAINKVGRSNLYSLTEAGAQQLAQNITNDTFVFPAQAGAKTVNTILSWFREHGKTAAAPMSNGNGNGKAASITSYEEFTKTVLESYDQLNRDYNLSDLVPIYRLRKEIGERVSRSQFNEWLLEVQANDLVQLMGGDIGSSTAEQREDSVTIPGGGLRFFAKRL
jgi:DNA-binding PadR family transcriptional regulator